MKRLIATTILLLAMSAPAWAATCSVSEFKDLVTESKGKTIQVAMMSITSPVTQTVSATTATAVSSAFTDTTRFLWIYCDEVMHIQIGTSPATGLTTGDMRIPAGGFWIGVPGKAARLGTLKIAFCDADCS